MYATMRKSTMVFGALLLATLASPALAQTCSMSKSAKTGGKDIVQTAVAAGDFNTLAAALKAADLVDALKGDGPFTVFAPTDEAFAKLPEGTLTDLLKPENKATLQAILKYHVVSGSLDASNVSKSSGATTLNGQRIDFKTDGGKVMVDGAQVVKANIKTSNGIIHVIDTVILPSSDNIVTTAKNAKMFNTLLAAAQAAGLAETLADGGPFTIFAPTDEAFGKLPEGTVASLLKPENHEQLRQILKYHVVSGRVYSDQAAKLNHADTLAEQTIDIENKSQGLYINDARVVKADIDSSNGVIHVIDTVILPEAK